MDRDRDYAFLATIQEGVYDSLGEDPRDEAPFIATQGVAIIDAMLAAKRPFMDEAAIAEMREAMLRSLTGLSAAPTPYESPRLHAMMKTLAEEIEAAAARLGTAVPSPPAWGTLPTGRVNALSMRDPAGDAHVVVFETGLFTFALLLSKVAAQMFPAELTPEGGAAFSTDPAAIVQHIRSHPEIGERLWDLLTAYVVSGQPGAAEQYIPPEPAGTLAGLFRSAMELFVIGHEYGHILDGHLADHRPAALLGDVQADEAVYNWVQELEADRRGLELGLAAAQERGIDAAMAFCGIDLFFHGVELVEQSVSILRTGRPLDYGNIDPNSTTHPPPILRRALVRQLITNSMSAEQAEGVIQLADQTQVGMSQLWETIGPALLRLRDDGVRPWTVWQ